MKYLKEKKYIGVALLLFILLIVSLCTYGNNKSKIFKDEYMNEIFVEENVEEDIDISKEVNLEVNKSVIVVEIKGEVLYPDVYSLSEGSIVKELIEAAGGLTAEADISMINRAKKLQNHELVVISNKNDINLSQKDDINIYSVTEENSPINLNTATIDELKKITGIGDVKAQSIINYREKNGGFKSIEEIKNIDGIGEKTFEKIKDEITY